MSTAMKEFQVCLGPKVYVNDHMEEIIRNIYDRDKCKQLVKV